VAAAGGLISFAAQLLAGSARAWNLAILDARRPRHELPVRLDPAWSLVCCASEQTPPFRGPA